MHELKTVIEMKRTQAGWTQVQVGIEHEKTVQGFLVRPRNHTKREQK